MFTNIASERQIKELLEKYNYETQKENIKTNMEAIRQASIFGVEEYNEGLKQKLKILNKKYKNNEKENYR